MSHLNSLGIIHYDVKPANIMFDSLMIVKIIDFGWSKTTVGAMPDGSVHCSLKGGTVSYKPPEGYDLVGTISNKVDVWATGITFYQMIYGKVPFGAGISHDDYIAQHREIHRDGFEFPTHITMTEIRKRFIKSCL
ncbi:hypothetical protein ACHAWU_005505, partial [Discostella pseudostelligera]